MRTIEQLEHIIKMNAPRILDEELPVPEHSLRDILVGVQRELAAQYGTDAAASYSKNVTHTFANNPALLDDIIERYGDREYGFIAHGGQAVALTYHNDEGEIEVLRITNIEENYLRGKHIHAPISVEDHQGIHISRCEPIVSIGELEMYGIISKPEEDLLRDTMKAHLYNDGFHFADAEGNTVFTRSGDMKVADPGAVITLDARLEEIEEFRLTGHGALGAAESDLAETQKRAYYETLRAASTPTYPAFIN